MRSLQGSMALLEWFSMANRKGSCHLHLGTRNVPGIPSHSAMIGVPITISPWYWSILNLNKTQSSEYGFVWNYGTLNPRVYMVYHGLSSFPHWNGGIQSYILGWIPHFRHSMTHWLPDARWTSGFTPNSFSRPTWTSAEAIFWVPAWWFPFWSPAGWLYRTSYSIYFIIFLYIYIHIYIYISYPICMISGVYPFFGSYICGWHKWVPESGFRWSRLENTEPYPLATSSAVQDFESDVVFEVFIYNIIYIYSGDTLVRSE